MTVSSSSSTASSQPARRSSRARQIIFAAVGTAIVFGGLFVWRMLRAEGPPEMGPGAVAVAAMQVQARDVPAGLRVVGSLRAVQEVTLAPEVAGRVAELAFEPGARVSAGTMLARLDAAPEKADREAAIAAARFARAQLGRSRDLSSTGAGSRERVDQRQSELEQAEATVRQLDARIAQKEIAAPFAGHLGVRYVNLGQYLNPGDAIVSLVALDRLFVDLTVPQQDLSQLAVGGSVTVVSDAWPDRTFVGRVTVIEPRVDENTRSVGVQAVVDNPDGALRPGMYVSATIDLAPEKNAVVVPTTTIQTSAAGDSVVVIRGEDPMQGGTAEIVAVTTGRRLGDHVVIASGLSAGDVVVTEGQLRVQPGAQVKVTRAVAMDEVSP